MKQDIRVRFAPSPTGPLHIGGVRTALFNYLFARKHKGTFILRIEDTDQSRYVEGAEEYIVEALKWCGITIDEGVSVGGPHAPYRQSERKEIYKDYANELIQKGWAYYAFDTPEELENRRKEAEAAKIPFSYDLHTRLGLRNSLTLSEKEVEDLIIKETPYVIRFKHPENHSIIIEDLIRGKVEFNTNTLDDKVLYKSDGLPTYHLANVVDDYLMKISHVIRGEEWLPSLPLHDMLYKAFGWEESKPEFAHLPLILKPSGKGKLSKRDGDQGGFPVFPLEWNPKEGEKASGYKEEGYFADGFVNMLCLLGWNPGIEQEIFSIQELSELFSLEKVGKSGSRFDPDKAKWFNQQYLKKRTNEELVIEFEKILSERGIKSNNSLLTKIVDLVKDRAVFVKDLLEQSQYLFEAPQSYDSKIAKKRWDDTISGHLTEIGHRISQLELFESAKVETMVKEYIDQNGINPGQLFNCFRLVLVGGSFGIHLFDIIEILGSKETQNRIENGIMKISQLLSENQ